VDFERANRERDRRLRKRLLSTLHMARTGPTGELGAQTLVDLVNSVMPPDQQFESDDHAIALIRDLVAKELATERTINLRRGERFCLRHLAVKVTAEGSSLINETLPPDPDIDDERIAS
jgi:hypothetical protein